VLSGESPPIGVVKAALLLQELEMYDALNDLISNYPDVKQKIEPIYRGNFQPGDVLIDHGGVFALADAINGRSISWYQLLSIEQLLRDIVFFKRIYLLPVRDDLVSTLALDQLKKAGVEYIPRIQINQDRLSGCVGTAINSTVEDLRNSEVWKIWAEVFNENFSKLIKYPTTTYFFNQYIDITPMYADPGYLFHYQANNDPEYSEKLRNYIISNKEDFVTASIFRTNLYLIIRDELKIPYHTGPMRSRFVDYKEHQRVELLKQQLIRYSIDFDHPYGREPNKLNDLLAKILQIQKEDLKAPLLLGILAERCDKKQDIMDCILELRNEGKSVREKVIEIQRLSQSLNREDRKKASDKINELSEALKDFEGYLSEKGVVKVLRILKNLRYIPIFDIIVPDVTMKLFLRAVGGTGILAELVEKMFSYCQRRQMMLLFEMRDLEEKLKENETLQKIKGLFSLSNKLK
jgi:hypothetical protein